MDSFFAETWNVRRQLFDGLLTTAEISFTAIAIGTLLGIGVGTGLGFGGRALRWPLRGAVDLVRGTPVLVLVFASFYLLAFAGLQMSAATAGWFALTIFCAAHLGEVFRGALQAVPPTQIEAGRSLGLSLPAIFLLVLLPQAVRLVLPVWVNTAVEIVKASTLLSVIGVGELLLKTQEVIGRTFMTLEFYALVGALYFAINLSIEMAGRRLARRMALPGEG